MSQTVNLTQVYPGINPTVVSVRAWFYTAPVPYGPIGTPPAETAANFNAAHFCIYEGFTGKNASGVSDGRGSEDTGTQTLTQAYPSVTSVETLLATAFPPPGPN